MKDRNLIIGVAVSLALTGCYNSNNVSETEESSLDEASSVGGGSTESTADDTADNTSSTKENTGFPTLVYGCSYSQCPSQATEDAVNDYLEEQGLEYRVDFVALTSEDEEFSLSTSDYANIIRDEADQEKIDLCNLAQMMDATGVNSFDLLKDSGYLEDLAPYLDTKAENCLRIQSLKRSCSH